MHPVVLPVAGSEPAVPDPAERARVLDAITCRIRERGTTIPEEIAERDLYFRVSVVGACNLSCTFCHNEGAPKHGKITLDTVDAAISASVEIGFTRVQFTGGEPLLRPDIADFVRVARTYVDDVGITTNGVYLPRRIEGLMSAGLQRLHVSLQTESLIEAGTPERWGIPPWLAPTVELAREGRFSMRVNLPCPADCLKQAERFLYDVTAAGVGVKVFSVLPEGEVRSQAYPLHELEAIVGRVNAERAGKPGGAVLLRGYRPPAGIRCGDCVDRDRCMEQSHSLRLGADLTLRPCLATRAWDAPLDLGRAHESIRAATLLALDYSWS